MYKGSLKYNLDPTGKISESDILSVLKKASLDKIILKMKEEAEKDKNKEEKTED